MPLQDNQYITVISTLSAAVFLLVLVTGWVVDTIVEEQTTNREGIADCKQRLTVLETRLRSYDSAVSK